MGFTAALTTARPHTHTSPSLNSASSQQDLFIPLNFPVVLSCFIITLNQTLSANGTFIFRAVTFNAFYCMNLAKGKKKIQHAEVIVRKKCALFFTLIVVLELQRQKIQTGGSSSSLTPGSGLVWQCPGSLPSTILVP